jgi:heterodisulfide reductase subunit C
MIRLGGLVSQKAFGKFEMGKVVSNPFATSFVNEAEGEDHEVSMANNSIDTIIKMATELKAKMGEDEKQIPAWIQDHIAKAENLISQASGNYHEYGQNEATINEDSETKRLEMLIKNLEETNKLLVQQLKDTKSLPSNKKENIKKSIALNLDLINYYKKWLKDYQAAANESVNEASPCWKGYKQVGMKDKGGRQVPNCVPNESVVNEAPNTGERIQNLNNRIKALRDKLSATKSPEQKKLFQDRLKNALQTLSNIKKDFGIKKEISNKTPKIFVKTAAVEKKIRELMADRKKAVVPYNTEKDPAKKEKLKQILIKLTQQIQGYEKNLIQLRDMEEEYLQQMHADAELDTTGL